MCVRVVCAKCLILEKWHCDQTAVLHSSISLPVSVIIN